MHKLDQFSYSSINNAGYKYQLDNDHAYWGAFDHIESCLDIEHDYYTIINGGSVIIKAGYQWDGPSGPMPDLASVMRASLIHDFGYQLIREDHLDKSQRKSVDKAFYKIMIDNRTNPILAWVAYKAVRLVGWRYIRAR